MALAARRSITNCLYKTPSIATIIAKRHQPTIAIDEDLQAQRREEISGDGAVAVVMGGFGFTQRALSKHEDLYRAHGFRVMPVISTINQLTNPRLFTEQRGPELAAQIQATNRDVVIHTVSGSFWTMMATLAAMDPEWRELHVRIEHVCSATLSACLHTPHHSRRGHTPHHRSRRCRVILQ